MLQMGELREAPEGRGRACEGHFLRQVWGRGQNNHSHLCLTLKAVLDLLPQGGRPQIRMGPSTAGLQRHEGRREHFSAILVQQALYVTPINVFRQFSVLEERAAKKTEPLRRVGKHLKRIH